MVKDTLRLVSQYWPFPQAALTAAEPLHHAAGRVQARQHHPDPVQQCLALPADFAQHVVPHLDAQHLLHYLTHAPRGLLYSLLSQPPHPDLKQHDGYFPNGFCRQKLLKKVADGCLKDDTCNDLLVQPDYVRHWDRLHRDMFGLLQSMQPLDGEDLRQLGHLFGLLQANGLLTSLHLTLDQVFTIFYNDVMAVRPQLLAHHPPTHNAQLVKYHYYLLEWIDIKSAGWPNRRLYTTLVAFLTYAGIGSGLCQPLYGMSVCPTSFNLQRCFRYARLDAKALLSASPEQTGFQPPRLCALDLMKDSPAVDLKPAILALGLVDAMAYPPPHQQNQHVTKFHQQAHHVEAMTKIIVSAHAQREAKFYLCLAQAESSYSQRRHYEVINTLLEVLANYDSYNVEQPHSVLHPSKYMPHLYLLLTKSLAHLHASDTTLLACFQQARQVTAPSTAAAADPEFALTLLTLLNCRGLLQQARVWATAVLDEQDNVWLLKQSSHLQALGVEYVQHTTFAWLNNQLGFLVGFAKFHQKCLHVFTMDEDASVQDLLQRMNRVVGQTRGVVAKLQRYLPAPVYASPWGHEGTPGQQTTLRVLQLKLDFYEWLLGFVSRKFFSAHPYNSGNGDGGTLLATAYHQDLVSLQEKCQSFVHQMPGRHPLYLEVRHLLLAMSCISEMCAMFQVVPVQRQNAYSQMDLHLVLYHLSLEENRAGTKWSKPVGNAAFQLYLWLSIGCMFNGARMKNKAYDVCVLKHAAAHLHHASDGADYRLPLLARLLYHVGYCSYTHARVPAMLDSFAAAAATADTTIFPVAKADQDCQCKIAVGRAQPSWLPLTLMTLHEENHRAVHVQTIQQGCVSLDHCSRFPWTAFLQTASVAHPYGSVSRPDTTLPAPVPHNVFLLHQLLRGADGCLLAKAVAYATRHSFIATGGLHAHCKVR